MTRARGPACAALNDVTTESVPPRGSGWVLTPLPRRLNDGPA